MMDTEEYRLALRAVIKKQMRSLVDQLCETGEEIAILSANMDDNSCCHFGTMSGEWFIDEQENLSNNFLKYCRMQAGRKATVPYKKSGRNTKTQSSNSTVSTIKKTPSNTDKYCCVVLDKRVSSAHTKKVTNPEQHPSTSTVSIKEKTASNTEISATLDKEYTKGEECYETTLNVKLLEQLTEGVSHQEVAGLVGSLVALTASNDSSEKLKHMLKNKSGIAVTAPRRSGRSTYISKTYKSNTYNIKSTSKKFSDGQTYVNDEELKIDSDVVSRLHVTTMDGRNVNIQTATLTFEICNTIAGPIIQELLDYDSSSSLDLGQTLRNSKHIYVVVGSLEKSEDGNNNLVSIEMMTQNTPESMTQNAPESATQNVPESTTMSSNGGIGGPKSSNNKKNRRNKFKNLEIEELDDKANSFETSLASETVPVISKFKTDRRRFYKELATHQEIAYIGKKKKTGRLLTYSDTVKCPCPTCGLVIKGRGNLRNHINYIHLKILNHHCTVCEKKFASNKARETHVLSVHTRRCGSCNSYVEESVAWDEGIDMSVERQVPCTCGATVNIWSKRGVKRIHDEEGNQKLETLKKKPTPTPPGDSFPCETCGKLFGRKDEQLQHCLTHLDERNLTCELCGLGYKHKNSLIKHKQRIHNEEFNAKNIQFACHLCHEKFISQYDVNIHKFQVHQVSGVKLIDIAPTATPKQNDITPSTTFLEPNDITPTASTLKPNDIVTKTTTLEPNDTNPTTTSENSTVQSGLINRHIDFLETINVKVEIF